jgi:hypothetical protein
MNLINQIRLYFWTRNFEREVIKVQRNRGVFSLDTASSIGILFDATDQGTYDKVCEFIKSLQDKNKNVRAIAFIRAKAVPYYCIPKLSFDFFTNKDLNWYYKPIKKYIDEFIDQDFNLCINLDLNDDLPLKYISGLSRANLKVGVYQEKDMRYYDLMIHMEDRNDLDDYISQINHYLSVMKAPS